MQRPAALRAGGQLIAQADIRECAAHHHFVIPAASPVGIEFRGLHAIGDQIFARGAVGLNRASGRDVIGGDAIAQHGQHARIANVGKLGRSFRHLVEKWRALDVSGFGVPGVQVAFRHVQPTPALVALEDFAVLLAVHLRGDGFAHRLFHFLRRRPNIAQVDRLAVAIVAERIVRHIEIHAAGQCVRDHQRRRGQIVRAHQRMNAALEIAIAAEHGNRDEAILLDRRADRFRKRAAIADARGAAKAHQIELQLFQILRQTGCLQVVRHDFRAWGEARLHPRLRFEPALDGLFGYQPAPSINEGFEVFVQLVMAAITTEPLDSSK